MENVRAALDALAAAAGRLAMAAENESKRLAAESAAPMPPGAVRPPETLLTATRGVFECTSNDGTSVEIKPGYEGDGAAVVTMRGEDCDQIVLYLSVEDALRMSKMLVNLAAAADDFEPESARTLRNQMTEALRTQPW